MASLNPNKQRLPDNRLSIAEFTIPPHTNGPPPHWHEMHDEIFLTTQGTLRFHLPSAKPGEADKLVDSKTGDVVTVPIRAPHTFSNPFNEEAKFMNTYTPALFINYFKMLEELIEAGDGKMTPDKNRKAMSRFATVVVDKPGDAARL
jgi:mannose-6-phosphate isomerase-like protein (cupin superfamily)